MDWDQHYWDQQHCWDQHYWDQHYDGWMASPHAREGQIEWMNNPVAGEMQNATIMLDRWSYPGNNGTQSVCAQQISPGEVKEGDTRSADGKAVRKKNKKCGRGREKTKQLVHHIARARSLPQIMETIYYELSDRTLNLTLKAIKLNPGNEMVWKSRRIILEKLDIDLCRELEDIGSIPSGIFAKSDRSMRNMWNHRIWIAEKLGGEYVSIELGLMRDVLLQNPKNQSYWVNLQQIVDKFPSELSYENLCIERILAENVKNDDVWLYALQLILSLGTEAKHKALAFAKCFLDCEANNMSAWQHCLSIASSLGIDAIREELKFVNCVIFSSGGKNNYAWSQRRLLCKELARHYSSKELEFDAKKNLGTAELELTIEILVEDGRNENAWQHRRWVLEYFRGLEEGFEFVNYIIGKDMYNDFAWNHRAFIVLRAPAADLSRIIRDDGGMSYAVQFILRNPDNECPWSYLKSIYDGTPYADGLVEVVCEFILPERLRNLEGDDDDAITNKKICLNALIMIIYLIFSGYRPSSSMRRMINNLNLGSKTILSPSLHEPDGSTISGFVDRICSILQHVDPTNFLCLGHGKTMLLGRHKLFAIGT